ncbi:MAG TPA: glycosyl hydrolase family 28-related protein [Patescibacteria group bacterium]|nr:glycosyl hydrolase family 28-related protein [Patescibacteria group bacterium]
MKRLRDFLAYRGLKLDNKSTTSLLVLLAILFSLPVGIYLVRQNLSFLPKAAGELIQLGEGGCIKVDKDKKKVVDCPLVPLKLTNPFFNINTVTATSSASPSQNGSLQPSPTVAASTGTGTPKNVNVKSFNNNVQQALDSIKTSGGSVYLPAGTYTITEKVRLYSNTTLFGDGMGASIIKFADNVSVDDMMANDTTSGQSNIVVRDLTLQGPDIPRILDKGHGLKLENLDNAYIINVEVNDVMMDGIYLGYKNKDGAPKGVTNLRISGCRVNRSQRQQIGLIMGSNVVIDGCSIDGTNKHGQQVYVGIDLEPDDATTPVSNSYIIGNTVSNTNIGIALNGSAGESKNAATVHDNKVCGNNVNAISIPIADSGQNNQISSGSCEIPGNLATLPSAPAKPAAQRDSLWASLVKTVSAQDSDDVFIDGEDSDSQDQFVNDGTGESDSNDNFGTGNPGSDKLLYRLSETQAGLNNAQWKEFAMGPSALNYAESPGKLTLFFSWVNSVISKITGSVSAQEQNCAKEGPADPSLTQNPVAEEAGQLGALKCNEEKENIGAGIKKQITVQTAGQNTQFNASTITNRQQSVYENGYVIHFWWSDGHESWDFKDKIGVLKKNTGFIKRNNFQKKTGDQQFNNGYVITTFADKTIEYNKFTGTGESIKYIPAESFALYNEAYTGGAPNEAPAIAAQVFGSGSAQVVQSQTTNIGNNNNGGNSGSGSNTGGGGGSNGGSNTGGSGTGGSGTAGTGTGGAGTGANGTTSGPLPQSSGTPSFSIGPQFINTTFQLADIKPGTKQIWVQFLHPDGTTRVDNVTFDLVERTPQILGLACNLDISKENLKITIEGEHFGNEVGTIETTAPSKLKAEVLGWNDKQTVGFLKKPNIPINEGTRFKIKVIRPDGFESGEAVCAVDKSLVSLGARIFCREPGKFDAKDVAVNLIYNPEDPSNPKKLNKVEEKVTIGADGEIANLKTKLQVDKNYAIAIKAPNSLRRTAVFTAQEGTTEILRPDGAPFILPVGDIAPPVSPDGRINTLDRSELIRQWRILGQTNTNDNRLTGDFNRDGRVNSIDWACMNYDFGQEDEPVPTSVPQPASGSLRIGGGQATLTIPTSNTSTTSSNSSSSPSSTPKPSGSILPQPSPSKDTSNSVKIDLGGKLFLDTNRNQVADIGESYISQGAAVVKLLQVPEEHIVGTSLTAEELADSKILTEVTNNLPGANYDISVFVDKDSGSKFSVLANANNGQLAGTIDFALEAPLSNSNQVINIPLTSATQ